MGQTTMFDVHREFRRICLALSLGTAVAAATSTVAQGQAVDTTKIVVGETGLGTSPMPYYIALEQGFFKNAGLNVEGQLLNNGAPAAMAAFAAGTVNVLVLASPELVQYAGNKVIAGKAFAELVDRGYDIVTPKNITSVAEIRGKTVGISGPNAGDYTFLVGTLLHNGLSPSDVTFVTTGNPINRLAAIETGAIQAVAVPNGQRAFAAKVGNIIIKSDDNPVQFPLTVMVAASDLINNHKPLLQKFVGALQQEIAWMRNNPSAAAAVCAKKIGATVQDCASAIALNFDRSASSKFTWSTTAAVNVEGIKSALEIMAKIDPKTKDLKIDDIVDTSFAGLTP